MEKFQNLIKLSKRLFGLFVFFVLVSSKALFSGGIKLANPDGRCYMNSVLQVFTGGFAGELNELLLRNKELSLGHPVLQPYVSFLESFDGQRNFDATNGEAAGLLDNLFWNHRNLFGNPADGLYRFLVGARNSVAQEAYDSVSGGGDPAHFCLKFLGTIDRIF